MNKMAAFIACCLLHSVAGPTRACYDPKTETLHQVSTLSALFEGLYRGVITCGELRQKGNIGIGTFDSLDGEMVFIDGQIWKIDGCGRVQAVSDSEKTPFACVTEFDTDTALPLRQIDSIEALLDKLDSGAVAANAIYAVKIQGDFKQIKTRSVPRQSEPYPKLSEVTKKQAVFEYSDIKGTILGFRFPHFLNGVNMPGWHLHFIADDRSGGGHLLECSVLEGLAELDLTPEFRLIIPMAEEFNQAELKAPAADTLRGVEK